MPRSKFSFDVPGRKDDETDLTDKQMSYIQHLAEEIDAEDINFEQVRNLGMWQASALINRLIEIRDGIESEKLQVSKGPILNSGVKLKWLIYLIFALAVLWFLAR